MADSRLSSEILKDLEYFINATVEAWRTVGLIKPNSYAVVIGVAPSPYEGFSLLSELVDDEHIHQFGETLPGTVHDEKWYANNAFRKAIISLETLADSHEVVRLTPGTLVGVDEGLFPWGGAIYDAAYGLVIGTSGFREDEDILLSRTVRNRVVMLLDRAGQFMLDEARRRGEQEGEAGADRFTRP